MAAGVFLLFQSAEVDIIDSEGHCSFNLAVARIMLALQDEDYLRSLAFPLPAQAMSAE